MKKKIACISGLSGFIGSHMSLALQKEGYKVVPITRDQLLSAEKLQILFAEYTPEIIIHAGAYGNHGMQQDDAQTVVTNIFGTFNLLEASKDVPYKAFINFSTSSVYGRKYETMKETDFLEPDTFYAATKASAEYLARAFADKYTKPIVNVRPFSIFGEGEADWRFIPTAIRHMLEGTTMSFVSFPQHDWLYVEDFVSGVLAIIPRAYELKGESINIGSGIARTNKEVIADLTYIADKGLKTEDSYIEPKHHSPVWVANTTKIQSIGWHPSIGFEEGLKRTYGYYKEKYEK